MLSDATAKTDLRKKEMKKIVIYLEIYWQGWKNRKIVGKINVTKLKIKIHMILKK
jgi:hypothetical protein